jgi:hypothetical protein
VGDRDWCHTMTSARDRDTTRRQDVDTLTTGLWCPISVDGTTRTPVEAPPLASGTGSSGVLRDGGAPASRGEVLAMTHGANVSIKDSTYTSLLFVRLQAATQGGERTSQLVDTFTPPCPTPMPQ